jgi:hypothetical protein
MHQRDERLLAGDLEIEQRAHPLGRGQAPEHFGDRFAAFFDLAARHDQRDLGVRVPNIELGV